MKKIFLVLAAAILCVSTASAQKDFKSTVKQAAETAASAKWSVGLRVNGGVQAMAECFYAGNKYVEGRLGLGIFGGLGADFTFLHKWNCCNWDWTPKAGSWFLDAGVGANVGGNGGHCYAGIAGGVKFGFKFNKVPIRLAFDYTPVVGAHITYAHTTTTVETDDAGVKTEVKVHMPTKFGIHTPGFYNIAFSATYCF